jgi:hypothetical protein
LIGWMIDWLTAWLIDWAIDCEGKASSIAHFPFTYFYPLPDDGRMTDRNVAQKCW